MASPVTATPLTDVTSASRAVDEAPPVMRVFQSTATGEDGLTINMQVILGKGCCHVWMGDAREASRFGALSAAVMTKFDSDASASTLLHDAEEDFSQSIASRLCKRLNMMVYVSCSVSPSPTAIPVVAALERQLKELVDNESVSS